MTALLMSAFRRARISRSLRQARSAAHRVRRRRDQGHGCETERPPSRLATEWHGLAVRSPSLPLHSVEGFVRETERRALSEFTARQVSTIAWASAKMQLADGRMARAVFAHALQALGDFDARSLATLAYAVGISRLGHEQMLEALCTRLLDRVEDLNAREVANIVYGLGRASFKHESCTEALCAQAALLSDKFKAQEVSSMVYSLGLLSYQHADFLRSACAQAQRSLDEFNVSLHGLHAGRM